MTRLRDIIPALVLFMLCAIGVAFAQATGNGSYTSGVAGNGSAVNGVTGTGTGAPRGVCIGGNLYVTTADDEFTHDSYVNYTASPLPSPAVGVPQWTSLLFNSGYLNTGLEGTDDAIYVSPGMFNGYNPFSIGSNGPLVITAQQIPTAYATASPVAIYSSAPQEHYESGALEGQPFQYGYVEFAAKVPNSQGWWPSLWLENLTSSGGNPPLIKELDLMELFGNSLPASTVQQTEINEYSPQTSTFYRQVVSPDPSTTYHTYGILWSSGSPGSVLYYVDHVPDGLSIPATSTGPMVPIIQLEVFAQSAFAPPPPSPSPSATVPPTSMYVQYYRQYQATGQACANSTLPVLPTVHPQTTPNPSPSPAATAAYIRHAGTMAFFTGSGNTAPTLPVAPTTGDLLIALISGAFTTAPAGWVELVTQPNGLNLYYGIVGSNVGNGTLSAATSYNFSGNGNIAQIIDIAGENASYAPFTTSGAVQFGGTSYPGGSGVASTYIPATGALNLDAYSGGTTSGTNPITSISDVLPTGQAESNLGNLIDQTGGLIGYSSMTVNQITSEAAQGGVPFSTIANFNFASTTQGVQSSGLIISVLPSGATPAPTPIPYPSPSLPPQSAPW